jgi:hypothetical protein
MYCTVLEKMSVRWCRLATYLALSIAKVGAGDALAVALAEADVPLVALDTDVATW